MPAVAMPRLSDSMEEGTILRWLVADGATVARGQEIVEIETEKARSAAACRRSRVGGDGGRASPSRRRRSASRSRPRTTCSAPCATRACSRAPTSAATRRRAGGYPRARGWSQDRDEFIEGVSCVSAPAFAEGVAIAAFTVSAPSPRFEARYDELLAAVRRAAASVAGALPTGEQAAA